MLGGTVCGLRHLHECLAVAIEMDALLRLTLLALGTVPLLVFLLATYGVLVARTDHSALLSPQQLRNSRVTRARLQPSLRLDPCSSHRPVVTRPCRLPTSSIVGLN